MKNKVETYENIFKNKYKKLKFDLESFITNSHKEKDKDDLKIKELSKEIENLKTKLSNEIQAPELEFPKDNPEITNLKRKNEELRAELRKKIDLMQILKNESKDILNEIQKVIENLTKKEEI